MVKQMITPLNNQVRQTHLSRLFFLSKGCKQVPLEYARGVVRWGHPDGYFLNEKGAQIKHTFAPSQYNHRGGSAYPRLRECVNACHILMALAFYGPRPTFENTSVPLQGKGRKRGSYVGICHHLIPDKLDYRPANLLCWLTREQHAEADRRQRALRKVVPDLHVFTYERLRQLQDPRTMSKEQFEHELAEIARKGFHFEDPQTLMSKELIKYSDE